jgi:hypothetical protein
MSEATIISAVHLKDETDLDWFEEAVDSVREQSVKDWKLIVVDDRSVEELPDFDDARITVLPALGVGVANARNTGAAEADDGPILFLDHDDMLTKSSLAEFLAGMEAAQREKHNDLGWVIYGDTLIVQENSQRHFASPQYDFNRLLKELIMPVGSLHLKAAWLAVNGMKPQMEYGLEDWEYWIALGEIGICGWHVPKPLYIYRFHERGRRAFLKSNPGNYEQAQARMRDLHRATYKGESPMGCCGGNARRNPPRRRNAATQDQMVTLASAQPSDFVTVRYGGLMRGFFVTGKATGIKYWIEAPGELVTRKVAGTPGVHRRDLPQLARYGPGVFKVE